MLSGKKNKKVYYLSLDPYVHGAISDSQALLYNTLNKKVLTIRNDIGIITIISRLLQRENGGVIPVTEEELNLPATKKFIKEIRHHFMGDIFSSEWSGIKPINILPQPIIKFAPFSLKDNLHEITLHINEGPDPLIQSYQNAFYQFLFPKLTTGKIREMDLTIVRSLIKEFEGLPGLIINILGPSISSYPQIVELFKLLQKNRNHLKIFFPLHQIDPDFTRHFNQKTKLSLLVTYPIRSEDFQKLILFLHENKDWKTMEFIFIVRDPDEFEQSQKIIAQLGLERVSFKPFFNGHNLSFFKTHVFMTESDILNSKPDQKQVLSRYLLNDNDFGKITLLPDGSVYANVNDPALGNLEETTVTDLIKRESETRASWSRIRMNHEPCKHCVYHFLCPPVSNYEIFLKKFNLCHIEIA